ncbi:hypothetical protein [Clostridium sp. AF22-10]|uniref:hypothetical protein n=1 Tax=Clostridium sp. AF22-10 TaxID=2293004 RepID=UPI000E54C991|nr:hypothetical protein DWX91_14220 [Clostridium sp. AF22-10]
MTNYEKFQKLSINQLARINVKPYVDSSDERRRMYRTTDNTILLDRKEAEKYEREWLSKTVNEDVFNDLLAR